MKHLVRLGLACSLLAFLGCDSKAPSATAGTNAPAPTSPVSKKVIVGFSQIGAESGWRTAETKSIKDEAAKRGIDLRFSDAQGDQDNQVRALRSFIQQKVDVIALAPKTEDGWQPVFEEAKKAGIPVILVDRGVKVASEDLYLTFIGSDFVEEGRRAAQWLVKATGGKATIAELQGTPGAGPAIDRKKGFEEVIVSQPGMKIVKSQSGNFERAKGKEVFESFLRSPEGASITALYAHNDDMALGAIQAIQAAGKVPGKDILIVSIDGVRDAFQAMAEGTLNCSVECSPLLGPQLFDVVDKVRKGESVPHRVQTVEGVFEASQVTPEVLKARQY